MDYKYSCKFCDSKYNSHLGLKKHLKNKHPNNNEKQPKINDCKYCGKIFSHRQSKWVHEKTCLENNNMPLAEQVKMLTEKVIKLENKKPTSTITTTNNNNTNNNSNNTTNNNNTQNVICVFPLGNEPANTLSIEYLCKLISDHGINSVMEIVKKKHFNPAIPECQNFCVTALNNNYASVVDPETKTIKSVNKKDVFDKVYSGVVSNVNSIAHPNDKVKETIDKINNIPVSRKMLKKLQCGMNEEAYHNRGIVKKTWKTAKFTEPIDNHVEERTPIDLNDVSSDSESECSMSDSSDDSGCQLKTTKVKLVAKPINKSKAISKIQKLLDEIAGFAN
jgi:hypothetical protein